MRDLPSGMCLERFEIAFRGSPGAFSASGPRRLSETVRSPGDGDNDAAALRGSASPSGRRVPLHPPIDQRLRPHFILLGSSGPGGTGAEGEEGWLHGGLTRNGGCAGGNRHQKCQRNLSGDPGTVLRTGGPAEPLTQAVEGGRARSGVAAALLSHDMALRDLPEDRAL